MEAVANPGFVTPLGGGGVRGANLIFAQICAENWIKTKEIALRGGARGMRLNELLQWHVKLFHSKIALCYVKLLCVQKGHCLFFTTIASPSL